MILFYGQEMNDHYDYDHHHYQGNKVFQNRWFCTNSFNFIFLNKLDKNIFVRISMNSPMEVKDTIIQFINRFLQVFCFFSIIIMLR